MTSITETINLTPNQIMICGNAAAVIRKHEASLKYDIIQIGKQLIRVKRHLDHGQFGRWLSSETEMSMRSAQRYMLTFESLDGNYDTVSHLPLKTIYEIAALSDSRRDEIIDMIADSEKHSDADIKKHVLMMRKEEKAADANLKLAVVVEEKKEVDPPATALKAAMKDDEGWCARREYEKCNSEVKAQELAEDAARWFSQMTPDLAVEIKTSMAENTASEIAVAMRAAATVPISEIASLVPTGSGTPADRAEVDHERYEVTDLDLSHAA